MKSRICGTGSALPEKEVTNEDLSKILETSDEWIRSRTGICSRHLAVEETLTGLTAEAAKKALQEAGTRPEELDLIISATLSADKVLPSLSCELQRELKAVNAAAFDINAACSGLLKPYRNVWVFQWIKFPQICRNVVIYQQEACRFC